MIILILILILSIYNMIAMIVLPCIVVVVLKCYYNYYYYYFIFIIINMKEDKIYIMYYVILRTNYIFAKKIVFWDPKEIEYTPFSRLQNNTDFAHFQVKIHHKNHLNSE